MHFASFGDVILGDVMLGYVILGYVILDFLHHERDDLASRL